MRTNPTARELLKNVQKLQASALQLTQLVKAQCELLQQRDYDALLSLLSQKQSLLVSLALLPHCRQALDQMRSSENPLVMEKIHAAMFQIDNSLLQVSREENRAVQFVQDRQKETAEELKTMFRTKAWQASYRQGNENQECRRIDVSS